MDQACKHLVGFHEPADTYSIRTGCVSRPVHAIAEFAKFWQSWTGDAAWQPNSPDFGNLAHVMLQPNSGEFDYKRGKRSGLHSPEVVTSVPTARSSDASDLRYSISSWRIASS